MVTSNKYEKKGARTLWFTLLFIHFYFERDFFNALRGSLSF